MSSIKTVIDKFYNVLKWIAGILLLIMLLITFAQVVMRKLFNNPFIWAEEVTLAMLIWFGYIAISLVVKDDEHMAIEFLYNKFGKSSRKFLDVVKHLLMMGFSILMVIYGLEMTKNAFGKVLPASQFSRTLLYMPLAFSGILICIFSLIHLINLFTKQNKEGGIEQ